MRQRRYVAEEALTSIEPTAMGASVSILLTEENAPSLGAILGPGTCIGLKSISAILRKCLGKWAIAAFG
jgi:hypothetical protein